MLEPEVISLNPLNILLCMVLKQLNNSVLNSGTHFLHSSILLALQIVREIQTQNW